MKLPDNIQITKLVQPEQGAIVFMRCSECNSIEIAHSIFAPRLKDGEFWFVSL